MPRYYDLDSLRVSDINVGTVMFPRMERCILLKDIESAPTADVVPKSEVDRLQAELDDFKVRSNATCKACGQTTSNAIEDLQNKLFNAKTEVAREIFEEIEKAVEDAEFEWGTIYGVKLCVAELKKKYTEKLK